MFYSTELLSFRRKGKLARCWLAATLSEKMFKKCCRPTSIQRIDVYHVCEEILSTVEIRNRNCGRFSLYLSSQLMYGVAKIHLYQAKFFLDYLFETNWKIFQISRPRTDVKRLVAEVPDVPPLNEVIRCPETSSNLHLIAEEPYTSIVERLIQDEMNFGVLPNHELESFISPGEELSLNQIRKFCWDDSEKVIEEPEVQVPVIDNDHLEMDKTETVKELRFASAKRDQRESLIAIEAKQFKKHVSEISKKRIATSPEEAPAKKRKTSSIEETTFPASEVQLHRSVLAHETVSTFTPRTAFQQSTIQQTLENQELVEMTKPRKKRRFYDKVTKLSDIVMKKFIQNVTAHTIEHHRFTATLPSAKQYLAQPSTVIFNKLGAKSLIKLFEQHLVGPFVTQTEFQILTPEIEETIAGETLRPDTSSKIQDQAVEISSKIGVTATEGTITESKTPEKIIPTHFYQWTEFEEHEKEETKEYEESSVELPEITHTEENIGIHLTKVDLLALMEVQWHDRRLITFHDLISPEDHNTIEAAYAFQYCLEFHMKKVIILKQAEPFDTIWIEKYPYYSSENSESTAAI